MRTAVRALLSRTAEPESGATAVEYALLAVAIAAVVVAVVLAFGSIVENVLFGHATGCISSTDGQVDVSCSSPH